ncbi:hypothetical protein B4U80_13572, partial [Leptotrombidium deliense]
IDGTENDGSAMIAPISKATSPIDFIVDHPFGFTIMDDETGVDLLIGIVTKLPELLN